MSNNITKVKSVDSVNNQDSNWIDSAVKKLLSVVTSGQGGILLVWLIMTTVNILNHHLIPLDETRYASVAWEMWYRQDYLVPHLNGMPYHHKPPLLFWLYDVGWSLFGVDELWLLLMPLRVTAEADAGGTEFLVVRTWMLLTRRGKSLFSLLPS